MSSRSAILIAISNDVIIPTAIRKELEDADVKYTTKKAEYWIYNNVQWDYYDKSVAKIDDFLDTIHEHNFAFIELGEGNDITEDGNLEKFGVSVETRFIHPLMFETP